jgi:hypothetical protein
MVPVIFDSSKDVEREEKHTPRRKLSRDTRNVPAMISHAGSTHPFSAFMVNPRRIRLDMQDDEEEILLLLRRHIVTNVPWILIAPYDCGANIFV